jgi:hypothetical protein
VALDGLQWLLESKWITGLVLKCCWSDLGCAGVALDWCWSAIGAIGGLLEWTGVGVIGGGGGHWHSTEWATMATGVKTVHWISGGVTLDRSAASSVTS